MKHILSRIVLSALLLSPLGGLGHVELARANSVEPPEPPPADKSTPYASKVPGAPADTPAFLAGYHQAFVAIYERNDYAGAIPQLQALGQDDRADVANLIGYAYRKLGDYETARIWYERALRADPDHIRTWQYYGIWQVERGNREAAQYHLDRIAALCGTGCEEYRSLAAAITQPARGQSPY